MIFKNKFVWAGAFILSTMGQFIFAEGSTTPTPFNGIVAIVNTDVVTSDELNTATNQAMVQAEARGLTLPPTIIIERQVLQGLIMQKIALQLAKLNNIQVSDEQVAHAIQNISAQNNMTVAQTYSKLASQGVDANSYQQTIRTQLIVQQLEQQAVAGSIIITPSQIDNYLASQARINNANTEYDVGHILIALPENPSADDYVTAKDKANMVIEKIKAGLPFSQAAMTYSNAGDALTGGDLGYKTLSNLPTIFVQPVSTMKVGDLVGPIISDSGYNIITLLGKKGGDTSDTANHYVTEFHVEAILMKSSPIMSDEAVQAEMQRLKIAIDNGVPFAKIAEANSQDYFTNKNGGDMGWVNPIKLDPILASRIAHSPLNTVVGPFQTSKGWYLIEVLATRQVNDTLAYEREQAQQALFMQKANEALMAWQAQIKGASYIDILDPNLAMPNDDTSGS
jgi:peptidyl-prolyl cis-trans isomerase SurA